MKALFITHYLAMLGANRSMFQLMIELREKGVEPTVLLTSFGYSPDAPLCKLLKEAGIPYIVAPVRQIKHPSLIKVLPNYIYASYLNRKVLEKVENEHFDIVHTNTSIVNVGSLIANKLNALHVWHLREFGLEDYKLKTPFGKWFQRMTYSHRSNYIAISQTIRDHYSKYIPAEKIRLIYNGIKKPDVNREDCIHSPMQFVVVGLIHENKGQKDIIDAVDVLVNKMKVTNFHLTVVGGGQKDYVSYIHGYTQDKGLMDYVTFTGYRNDVNQFLSKMDVGIIASRCEAFGRVTVEYMMSGLTVIASNTGANEEIIKNGETGMIYKWDSPCSMAENMAYLIQHPETCANLSIRGKEDAIQHFSSDRNSSEVYDYYCELLQEKRNAAH